MWAVNGSYEDANQDQGFTGTPYLSKFGPPLPSINPQDTPQPNDYNQVVPFGGRRSQLSNVGQQPVIGDYNDGRVRQVEGRLGLVEQSNRALLEEVVRLQGELKSAQRRTDEVLQAERQARQQLTENIRASNDLIGQLGARLKRAEEKVADERTAVGALVNHTKQVEQAVLGSQQELVAKRDQQLSKIAELRNDLDETNRLREQLERATTTLVDEVRQLKGKQDATGVEYSSLLHDVKERTKRLEEEQRQAKMDHQRKFHENQHSSEQTTSVLRTQLDARLGEVRDVLMDLRNRVQTEETERRQQEQGFSLRVNELQGQINEQNRKRDESMHALDVIQREREHAADNERLKMQGKIAEIAEEVSRKILSKEIRLREEAQQKFGNIEKYLHAEQAARIAHEQAMREENEKRWAALQKLTEEEVLHVREGQKIDRSKNLGGMSKVNEVMDKLEKQQVDTKKQLEQVMKAEIKSRQSQDKQIEEKIEDVQEKLGVAISTLQQAIGGINEQVSSTTVNSQDQIRAMIAESSQSGLRGLADLDARVVGLQTRVSAQEETIENQIQEAVTTALEDKDKKDTKKLVESQAEQLEEIGDWRDSTEKKLKSIRERMDELGPEIREMNRTNESIQEDMKGLVESEGKDRVRDVQMVRQEFTVKFTQFQAELEEVGRKASQQQSAVPVIPVSQKEKLAQGKGGKVDDATKARVETLEEELLKQNRRFTEVKDEVDKIESSVQTVRVHLTRKVDSETKARREEIADLQNTFEDLKVGLTPILNQAATIEQAMKKAERSSSGRCNSAKSQEGREESGRKEGRKQSAKEDTKKDPETLKVGQDDEKNVNTNTGNEKGKEEELGEDIKGHEKTEDEKYKESGDKDKKSKESPGGDETKDAEGIKDDDGRKKDKEGEAKVNEDKNIKTSNKEDAGPQGEGSKGEERDTPKQKELSESPKPGHDRSSAKSRKSETRGKSREGSQKDANKGKGREGSERKTRGSASGNKESGT